MPKRPSTAPRKSSQRIIPPRRINKSPATRKEQQPEKSAVIPEDLENKADDAIPEIQTPPPIPENLPQSDVEFQDEPMIADEVVREDEVKLIHNRFAPDFSKLAVDPDRRPEQKDSWLARARRWFNTDVRESFGSKEAAPVMSERAGSLLRATEDVTKRGALEAERLGVAHYLKKFSEKMLKPLTLKERVALTAVVMTAGMALGVTAAVPLILRGIASVSLAAMAKSGTQKMLEKRGMSQEQARELALVAGAFAFSAAFVGGHYASQYFAGWVQSVWDTEPSSIAVAPEAPTAPAPAESSFIHTVSNDSAAIAASEPPMEYELLNPNASDAVPAPDVAMQPEVSDVSLSRVPDPIEISGDMSVWGSFTDSLADHGIDLHGREDALAQAVQRAIEETGTQSEFLEHGGRGLSHVAWNKIPDGTMVHFDKLFDNVDFKEKLTELLESKQYKSLGAEIAKQGGVSDFLDKLTASYGAR